LHPSPNRPTTLHHNPGVSTKTLRGANVCRAPFDPKGRDDMGWKSHLLVTLQETNISHLGKRKIIFKMPFLGDMLVPWRVVVEQFI